MKPAISFALCMLAWWTLPDSDPWWHKLAAFQLVYVAGILIGKNNPQFPVRWP